MMLLFLALALAAEPAPPPPPCREGVVQAIADAVRVRMGAAAAVDLDDVACRIDEGHGRAALEATPEPNARVGRRARFTLTERGTNGPRRVGYATAIVRVRLPYVRLARAVGGGQVLTAADVEPVEGDPGPVLMRPLPGPAGAAGARVTRSLAAGETLLPHLISRPPLVRSGDVLRVRAVVGPVEVTGRAIAAQQGGLGEIIRVVNPDNNRSLKVRVVGPGEVEVVHGS